LVSSCFFAFCWELPSGVEAEDSFCQALTPSPTLTQFVDKLPIPYQIPVNTTEISIGAWKIKQKLHRDLPPTTLYAYGESRETAVFPGPTFEATLDVKARIHWENHIPDDEHFLPVDTSINWARPKHGGVPIVVHLHGAETESIYDGHPDAWWTPKGEHGYTYATQHYSYPNSQRPALLWYHDHVVGITRLNVLAGLTGLYFVRSPKDKLTKLFPYGEYEIPFVLRDWQFWANGSINFPNIGDNATIHPTWCPEYFGDTILVNGKAWPYLEVYPRVYRLRILNSANARFFNLSLSEPSLRFHKIGTDGGYLETKPQILKSVLVAPAERLDLLIDFSKLKPGDVVYINNSGPAPFPDGTDSFSPPQTRSVLKFQVTAWLNSRQARGPSNSDLRHALQYVESARTVQKIKYTNALHRYMSLQEFDDANDNPIVSLIENRTWRDPVVDFPREGAVEVWEWINTTPDAHPIHVHLIQFKVLNLQPFDENGYLNGSCNIKVGFSKPGTCFTGPPIPPKIYHTGFKDTAIVWPNFVTRYGIRFQTSDGRRFPFDPTLGPGYVFHCHILDHEDNDMMRPYKLIH